MPSYAALRVKIGIRQNKRAKYPDFNLLPVVISSGQDWSVYIDKEGSGWKYDRVSGHSDDTATSPRGQQWGLLLIPEQFAIEAVAQFPTLCQRITEAQTQKFYDEDHAVDFEDDEIDETILTKIKLKNDLGIRLTAADTNALDPTHKQPGVRENYFRKVWVRYKARRNITIVDP